MLASLLFVEEIKLFSRGTSLYPQGIAYVPIQYIDVFDAIRVIREAGGIPVLAHPGQFNNFEAVAGWAAAGLEGIEVKQPLHNEEYEMRARGLAERYGLVQTGGSDFHGFYGDSGAELGSKNIGMAHFEELKKRKAQLGRKKEQV